jgi:hypothetical protein
VALAALLHEVQRRLAESGTQMPPLRGSMGRLATTRLSTWRSARGGRPGGPHWTGTTETDQPSDCRHRGRAGSIVSRIGTQFAGERSGDTIPAVAMLALTFAVQPLSWGWERRLEGLTGRTSG